MRLKLPSKAKAWDSILHASGLVDHAWSCQDAAFMRRYKPGGKRPDAWGGGSFDCVNAYLGLEGPKRICCPFEGFCLLTHEAGVTRWDELEPVLARLRGIDGLESLRLPQDATRAVAALREYAEAAERAPLETPEEATTEAAELHGLLLEARSLVAELRKTLLQLQPEAPF